MNLDSTLLELHIRIGGHRKAVLRLTLRALSHKHYIRRTTTAVIQALGRHEKYRTYQDYVVRYYNH